MTGVVLWEPLHSDDLGVLPLMIVKKFKEVAVRMGT